MSRDKTGSCLPNGNGPVTLGLNLMGHDISYCVLDKNGQPLLIAEEERYSRRKKGTFVPPPSQIDQVLEEAGVSPEAVKHLAIANIPEFIENRPLHTQSRENMPAHYGQAKCFNALFRAASRRLVHCESVISVRHHLCHAASAFLPSPFESSAVVTADGMGEDETATIWFGEGTHLEKLFSIRHPHSLGYVYQAVAQWTGMTGAEREGKLMGLSSLGEPSLLSHFRTNFVSPHPDLGFAVADALASRPCDNQSWVSYCEQHLGSRRLPDEKLSQYHCDVAASVQALVEEILQNLLSLAARLTGSRRCCVAGGVFMNSLANGRLRREGPFENLWVQPMASDNGLSLGAALWAFTRQYPKLTRWQMKHPFWGSDVSETEIRSLISRNPRASRRSGCVELETAKFLAEGKLVGWVQGRSEVGARSLGHRSIFADPRDPQSKDRLNSRIKHRECWRPFAPMVIEEEASKLFIDSRPSPFMTFVTPALPRASIPAALHVDNTARIQTVNETFDPRLHKLLCCFRELTGMGVLLNTSFNLKGEPIVRTCEEAYEDFRNSGMDVLVVGDYIFEKTDHLTAGADIAASCPPPRLHISERLISFVKTEPDCAVVSLGSREYRTAVQRAAKCSFTLFLAPPPGKVNFTKFASQRRTLVDIQELASYDPIIVLLPTWVEVAGELIPKLIAAFWELQQSHHRLRVFVADEAGGFTDLPTLLSSLARDGVFPSLSEIEAFWCYRRAQDKFEEG